MSSDAEWENSPNTGYLCMGIAKKVVGGRAKISLHK